MASFYSPRCSFDQNSRPDSRSVPKKSYIQKTYTKESLYCTLMDPFLQKVHARPINGKYTLTKQLGKGGYGIVYLARDVETNRDVAMKLEHHSIYPSHLEQEAETYRDFQDVRAFPNLYWYGQHDDFRVMAFELLGPSLEDLFAYCEHRFTLKTTLMILDQVLTTLEELHVGEIVHRDIKPRNFLLGSGTNGNMIYLTDFGLATMFTTPRADKEETSPSRLHLIGTAMFASIRGHQGRSQSPRDDLESLGYVMVYFLRGRGLLQGLKRHGDEQEQVQAVMQNKMMPRRDLCKGLPAEFAQYMEEVDALRDEEVPNYERLRSMFQQLGKKQALEYDSVFDWTERWFAEHGD